MPLSIFFFKELNTLLKWIGFILGIVGVLFMLNPAEINWTNLNTLLTLSYLMSASLALSIGILCARYMTWHHTPLELIPWQLLLGSIILVIVAVKMEPYPTIDWNLISTSCLAYTGVIATAIGFLGMSKVSKELPATLTSIGLLGVPVSGVIFSVIILHESVDIYKILAMLFITAGVICVVCGERKTS
jgi:drug/metabolite transporter (DMT)-like permease